MRHVVLPQAVRRVAPPLLNDFISLQKDVALISILGPLEAFRVAQIEASSNFVYTPLVAAALLYLCVTVPLARLLDRWERRRAAMTAGARGPRRHEGLRRARRAARDRPRGRPSTRAIALIGASGSGKSTLLRCIDLLEEIDDGDVLLDGEVITDPSVDAGRACAAGSAWSSSVQPLPAPDALENVTLAPVRAHGDAARGGRGAGARAARALRAGRARARPPRPALRRPAAARRDRPRAGDAPARAAARRGHERARPRAGRRGARGRSASSRPRG